MIVLHTNQGDIHIELDEKSAPKTCENFLNYVKEGFYNNTIFHRVINNFMIQGGGFGANMTEKKTKAQITNEADNGLKNNLGSIAMARTSDPHSASAQFFINVANNAFLNHRAKTTEGWGYCVFGHVVKGLDVIDAIKVVKTKNHAGHQDVPEQEIIIETAEIIESH